MAVSAEDSGLDVVVVGAGFSGLYMLHKLRGLGFRVQVFEAGSDVGGTWYWNRYPGARVDIESHEYSYSFSPELEDAWVWTERYAAQPEILRYLEHVADRFDLRRDIRFETKIASAVFNEADNRWTLTTAAGETVRARWCVMATGCLSVPKDPDIPGADRFGGPTYHTGTWPHEGVDFTGKRVAVIGTGSSAIQSIPQIARQAAHVTVFQRTPNYSVPAHNGPADPKVAAEWKARRAELRAEQRMLQTAIVAWDQNEALALEASPEDRERVFEDRWARGGFSVAGAYGDILLDVEANKLIAGFAARKIRELVRDPAVADKLTPKTYPFASKRLCVDIGYYETFNRPNVSLVDLTEEPIETITPSGVKTAKADYAVDAIVYAVGFDAMTGALSRIDIRGRGGLALRDAWREGPKTYLGLSVAGFPNLFMVTGPGSPSVLSNMVVSIEQHVDWIADCMSRMRDRQLAVIEATPEAQEAWVAHVNEAGEGSLYPLANSWYLGANVPGKPRVFMPYVAGVGVYRETCDRVAAEGYEGFALSPSVAA